MIIKAGTYRFNDVLTEAEFEQSINIIATGVMDGATGTMYISKIKGLKVDFFGLICTVYKMVVDGEEQIAEGTPIGVYSGADKSWQFPIQTHTITEDTEVDDTFGAWYIHNTNYNEVSNPPLAEITYNGETIAKINAGETVILKCEGLPMETDIIVKVNG